MALVSTMAEKGQSARIYDIPDSDLGKTAAENVKIITQYNSK